MTIQSLIIRYQNDLKENECYWILEEVLGSSYIKIADNQDVELNDIQYQKFIHIAEKILEGMPIQYALGTWNFAGLDLKVDKRGLIPRAETEYLALEVVKIAKRFTNPRIIDIGCGSGCIGLYIKSRLPNAIITLCDISEDAISLSQDNAKMNEIDVEFIHSNMVDIYGEYDIIVSNPPYITAKQMDELDKSVKDYEPNIALYGGEDGLDFYRILAKKNNILSPNGFIALEIGMSQGKDVSDILMENFKNITVIPDISGLDRIIIAEVK